MPVNSGFWVEALNNEVSMSFLCPVNDCVCRCDEENGDYCHYSDDEAERQKLEIKTNYSDTDESSIDDELNRNG